MGRETEKSDVKAARQGENQVSVGCLVRPEVAFTPKRFRQYGFRASGIKAEEGERQLKTDYNQLFINREALRCHANRR